MIPNDPAILLSFVNTKLRDFYSNLDDMCDDMELEIQVKLHKNENSPLQICEENEFETEEVPDIINAELAKEITGEDVGELYKMGCAVTIRNSLVHNGSELCLDKTTYFDKTDYEVEVEYEEKISADLLMKLTSLGVRFNEKCVGKFSRFLAEYKNQE